MNDPELLRTAWRRLLAVADDLAGRPVAPDLDEVDTVESFRHLATLVGHAVDMFVVSRPEAPVFVRAFNTDEPTERKYLGDNADTRYFYANVSDAHRYVIRGRRGDEVYLSFVLHAGHRTDSLRQLVASHISQQDLVCDPDGGFEIVLSPERPEGAANWMALPEGSASLLTREYYLDRSDARVARYTIERTDGPPAPLTAEGLAVAIEDAAAFLDTAMGSLAPRPVPSNTIGEPFRFGGPLPGWGTPDNTYCGVSFDLGPDDALDIEGLLVPCVYWNVQLWNRHMQSIGVPPHAASVNHAQLGLQPGDAWKVTVASRDPGTRPWIDTHAHARGTVYIRWLCATETPPTPTVTVRPIG